MDSTNIMKINKSLFYLMLKNTPPAPPESGGILGSENGVITHFFADAGLPNANAYSSYHPNIDLINKKIEMWADDNISFGGMYHTHLCGGTDLSEQDKKYINNIMLATNSECLFFPIILCNQMIAYRSFLISNGICVERTDIELK